MLPNEIYSTSTSFWLMIEMPIPAKSIAHDIVSEVCSGMASNASEALETLSCLRDMAELLLWRGLYTLRSGLYGDMRNTCLRPSALISSATILGRWLSFDNSALRRRGHSLRNVRRI